MQYCEDEEPTQNLSIPAGGILCVITGRFLCSPDQYQTILESILEARPDMIQLREKDEKGLPAVSDRVFYEEGCWLRGRCREKGILLIVDDRLDMAMALDADGVHLGRKDLPLWVARRLWNQKKLYGISVGSIEEAQQAELQGASYLGYGAVFPTKTKQDIRPNNLEGLEAVCKAVRIPVLAIGGIGMDQVPQVMKRGCAGIAVVSAVWKAPHPGVMVRTIKNLMTETWGCKKK